MSDNITKFIDFTQPQDFQANPEIVINGNGASLVPINNLQPNWLCGARFDVNLNLNWGKGSLIGTPNGAVITGGKLDLRGYDKYLDFSAVSNANMQQKGTVKFMFTPDWSGNPAALTFLFSISDDGILNNSIALYQSTDGHLNLAVFDKNASAIISADLGIWNPTTGSEKEFALCFDLTAGATRLFIEGVQFGTTATGTGIRDVNINLLRLGGNYTGAYFCNGYMRNLLITNDVLYTSNYTPGYTIPAQATSYPTDSPGIIPSGSANKLPTTGLVSMVNNSQIPVGTDIRMRVKRPDGLLYFYDGSEWLVSSDASGIMYSSNSITALTSAILQKLNLSDGEIIEFYFYLTSTGNATPILVSITMTAEKYYPLEDTITPCTVYGYTLDASGAAVQGVSVQASLPEDKPYQNETMIVQCPPAAISNAVGYWQLDLLPLTVNYKFSFTKAPAQPYEVNRMVPESPSAAFNTLREEK